MTFNLESQIKIRLYFIKYHQTGQRVFEIYTCLKRSRGFLYKLVSILIDGRPRSKCLLLATMSTKV